jgi:CheY-like chemotaxis protein
MGRVLIVDDDAALREALEAALTSLGHEVVSAQDGLAALRAAVDTGPDVIISDVNMPYLEGPDAVRILRALPRFRRVPVILMSGAELPATHLAQAEVRKPVTVERLLELVDRETSAASPSTSSGSPAPIRAACPDEEPNSSSALGSLNSTECAVRIRRGIELMHAQATRISRLRELGLPVGESERLYECLVNSIASLVQCLPAAATMRSDRRRRRPGD